MKRVLMVFLAVLIVFSFGGCKKKVSPPLTCEEDLKHMRIGIVMGWDTDMLLSERKDLKMYRYDTVPDMLMGVIYGMVDVAVVDEFTATAVLLKSEGLSATKSFFKDSSISVFFSQDNEELCNQFNAFLAEFFQTEDYEEWQQRIHDYDGMHIDTRDIPLTGTGETLKIGYDTVSSPLFIKNADGTYGGYGLEILCRFANAYNYRLELSDSSYTDSLNGVLYGKYDIGYCWIGERNAEAARKKGLFVSDPFIFVKEFLVQVTDTENLTMAEYSKTWW